MNGMTLFHVQLDAGFGVSLLLTLGTHFKTHVFVRIFGPRKEVKQENNWRRLLNGKEGEEEIIWRGKMSPWRGEQGKRKDLDFVW